MSVNSLEHAIIAELRGILRNPRLVKKDLLQWSTSKEPVEKDLRDGERLVHCDALGVWVAVAVEKDRREHIL